MNEDKIGGAGAKTSSAGGSDSLKRLYEATIRDERFFYDEWLRDMRSDVGRFGSVDDWMTADAKLLHRLIAAYTNGIARIGQGCMSKAVWERSSAGPTYRKAAKAIAESESRTECEIAVRKHRGPFFAAAGKNFKAAFNRMVCALQPEIVIAIPNEHDLRLVYDFLAANGFIIRSEAERKDWFAMAASVRKLLKAALSGVDIYEASAFAWFIAMAERRNYDKEDSRVIQEVMRRYIREVGLRTQRI